MSAINTAVSGLQAATTRLDGAAANTANMRTRGPVPETPPSEALPPSAGDGTGVYQAVDTVQTADKGAVRAKHVPTLPSYLLEYDPESALANEDGVVAAPNVDPVEQTVEQIEAQRAFAANLSVIRTADEMERSLLNLSA
jgi:flagellar basal-body rod protein FlgC